MLTEEIYVRQALRLKGKEDQVAKTHLRDWFAIGEGKIVLTPKGNPICICHLVREENINKVFFLVCSHVNFTQTLNFTRRQHRTFEVPNCDTG